MSEDGTGELPLSCGDAWIKYFLDEELADGMSAGNWVDEAHRAFDAGWNAALAATGTRNRE